MGEALRDRVSETAFIDILVDELVGRVNQQHPKNQAARLRVYDTIADKLSGLARALKGETKHEITET